MRFTVTSSRPWNPPPRSAYLATDNWNDFGYRTLFELSVVDEHGEIHEIGGVKIASFDMDEENRVVQLAPSFRSVGGEHFSVGQDVEYYVKLNALGDRIRDEVLEGLGDIAANEGLFDRALELDVTTTALFRFVSASSVETQFRRIARGGETTISYEFDYALPRLRNGETGKRRVPFSVQPGTNPPTNIHAVIGSNGAGKTRLLDHLKRSILYVDDVSGDHGHLRMEGGSDSFAGVVTVSFSAFDDLEPVAQSSEVDRTEIATEHIGLQQYKENSAGLLKPRAKSAKMLRDEFALSVRACVSTSRAERWLAATRTLQADPLLSEIDFEALVDPSQIDSLGTRATSLFRSLSSGHQIVMLTITRLVELVGEQTLVLMDEPESHLHPPLLSAFVNALSNLLTEMNGVAIVATHSPVVLQEIPRSCVWIIRRSGSEAVVRRPRSETFGENVGELTHEVFKLEVTATGYHDRLRRAAQNVDSYEQLLGLFNGQIGAEGRAIAQLLMTLGLADDPDANPISDPDVGIE